MKTLSIASLLAFTVAATACTIDVGYLDEAFAEPPQNWAQLYAPPSGCEEGPFSLALINETDMHVAMTIDAEDIEFLAPEGSYAELFPMTTAFICLDETGGHALTGQAFTDRYDDLVAIEGQDGSFSWNGNFGISVAPSGRHEFRITPTLLLYY